MDETLIFDRYYNLALRFLSFRPRSEKEVLDYLKKKAARNKSLTPEITAKIKAKLVEYNFINDLEFTKFWIEQRIKFKGKPIWTIKFELEQKGISKELIDQLLPNYEDKSLLDLTSAKKLAEKKLDFYRGLPPQKRREKVMNYLLRKGFNYDIVKNVLK